MAKTFLKGGSAIPKIAVILPVYNAEKYIAETLDSIKKQTVKPYQIIMVNDCSTDNSFKVAHEWVKQNKIPITFYKNLENSGIGFTRDAGLNHCEADYITYLSSDDVWHPEFLEKCLPYLNERSAVFTDYYQCDQYLKPFNIYHAPKENMREKIVEFALEKNMFVNFSNVVFPKQIFTHCRFTKELRHGEDLIFLLDTVINGLEYTHITEPLSYYRIHPKQGTNIHDVEEWKQLWRYIRIRLLLLGIPENIIEESKAKNYNDLYPHQTFALSTRKNIVKLLNRNKYGLKTKTMIKKIMKVRN